MIGGIVAYGMGQVNAGVPGWKVCARIQGPFLGRNTNTFIVDLYSQRFVIPGELIIRSLLLTAMLHELQD